MNRTAIVQSFIAAIASVMLTAVVVQQTASLPAGLGPLAAAIA